jgi:hypothetical protein
MNVMKDTKDKAIAIHNLIFKNITLPHSIKSMNRFDYTNALIVDYNDKKTKGKLSSSLYAKLTDTEIEQKIFLKTLPSTHIDYITKMGNICSSISLKTDIFTHIFEYKMTSIQLKNLQTVKVFDWIVSNTGYDAILLSDVIMTKIYDDYFADFITPKLPLFRSKLLYPNYKTGFKAAKMLSNIFDVSDKLRKHIRKYKEQLDYIGFIETFIIGIFLCIKSELIAHPYVILEFLRCLFDKIEYTNHNQTAFSLARKLKTASILTKLISTHILVKPFHQSIGHNFGMYLQKQSEKFFNESILCDIFKDVISYKNSIGVFPLVSAANQSDHINMIYEKVKRLPETLQCRLYYLIQFIQKAIIKNRASKTYENQHIKKLFNTSEKNWMKILKQIYNLKQTTNNTQTSQQQEVTHHEVPQTSQDFYEYLVSITPNKLHDLKNKIDKLTLKDPLSSDLLRFKQDYKIMEVLLSQNQGDVFQNLDAYQIIFIQRYIKRYHHEFYIPNYNTEYMQQVINTLTYTSNMMDSRCIYTSFQPQDDENLFMVKGNELWFEEHFSQQGINELFNLEQSNSEIAQEFEAMIEQSQENFISINNQDSFHMTRAWCKQAYMDYKDECEKEKCSERQSLDLNLLNREASKNCFIKRKLYARYCNKEHPDDEHIEQIEAAKDKYFNCNKIILSKILSNKNTTLKA